MRIRTVISIGLVGVLAIATLAAAQRRGWGSGAREPSAVTSRPATTGPVDAYAIVVDRNIFLRDRRPPVVIDDRPPASRPYVPPPSLESQLVLRGVVLEENAFHAYFENVEKGEMLRVAAGDPLARGRVADISIDALEFETPGGAAWIKIGDNLAGARVAESTPSAATATQPAAGATSNPALSGIEERMRQRRMQRGGGGR